MGVEPKIGGFTPKMDGENNGKPYEQMDDLGVPLFFGNTHVEEERHLWCIFLIAIFLHKGVSMLNLCTDDFLVWKSTK